MPDSITPVGAMIRPPDPQQGIGMLSSILGIQQQQQNLQRGAAETQTAEATASQSSQRDQQLTALSKFTRSASQDPAYLNADGTANVDKYQQDARKVSGIYGEPFIGQMTTNFTGAVENRKALLSLSNEQRATAGNYFAAVAAKPGATKEDLLDAVDQARSVSPDKSYQRTIDSLLMHVPQTENMPTDQASLAIRQAARVAAVGTNAVGAAQSNIPASNMVQGPKGLVPTNISPQAPMPIGPVGPTQAQGAAPQIVSPPGGVPTVMGPGGAGTTPSGPKGPQPTTQDWENFGAYQGNLNARVRMASDSIPRIQAAEHALDAIRGGAGAEAYAGWAQRLQAIGAPQPLVDAVANGNLASAQEAEKYLFQTTFSGLKQAMQGDPSRVSEFNAAEKVFPRIGTDPRATKNILNFMTAQGQRDFAEQQSLTAARKSGDFNPATWEADYQANLRAGKVPGVPSSQIPGAGLKEGDKQKSKSGRPMTVVNGHWTYD